MIISHQFRFIFIKTIKTAGTSIEAYLSPLCGQEDVFTPINPPETGHQARNFAGFHNHMSAWQIRRAVDPTIWNSYFKFCVERNPWDKTVSDFCMANQRAGSRYQFDDYFRRGRFCRSWELYTNDDGTLLADRVLRYEHLNQELGEVFAQLGVPWAGELKVWAKSAHRTDRKPYQQWYTPEQAAIVQNIFADEIRAFDYAF
ncbi:MAG: hypothetical protein SH820_03255 [Xanthomonadales bacterium]|nr:hypothetical protein [Xanthomonadales bacterium]